MYAVGARIGGSVRGGIGRLFNSYELRGKRCGRCDRRISPENDLGICGRCLTRADVFDALSLPDLCFEAPEIPDPKPARRRCLWCLKFFDSIGPHNRFHGECRTAAFDRIVKERNWKKRGPKAAS